jgi:hypothetical protein
MMVKKIVYQCISGIVNSNGCVSQIILESPLDEWHVSYQQDLFTTPTYLCKDEHTYKTLCMFFFGKAKECTKLMSTLINEDK